MSTTSLWLCYVDDTFAAVNKDNFHELVNKEIVDIQLCTVYQRDLGIWLTTVS